jgi:germination protein M
MFKRISWSWHIVCLFITAGLSVFYLAGCSGLFSEPDPGAGEGSPGVELQLPDPPPQPPGAGAVRRGLLYYPDEQYRFLIPVQRNIPFAEAIAKVTLERLVATPELESELKALGLAPALPEQTTVRGIAINQELARVDFSASFINYPPERERLVLGSVLCTLRQFPTIARVEIMLEGAKLEQFPGGTPGRVALGPQCWINLDIDDAVEDYRNFSAVKLYYCYPAPNGWIFYVPVTRIVAPVEDEKLAAAEELLKGPPKGIGLFSDIPRGTRLLGLNFNGAAAEINLSREVLDYRGGVTGAENWVKQILLTLTSLEGVEEVQILVEGEKITLKEGLDLTKPLQPPEIVNFF